MAKQDAVTVEERAYIKKIGDRFRSVREDRGYSNYEVFAHENNISRSQVWKYEKGSGNPTLISLLKMIKALDMTPAEFFKTFDNW